MVKKVTLNRTVTTYPAEVTVEINKIDKAIEISSEIPADAKKALKDFIQENFPDLMEHITNIENYPVPEEIAEWWPLVEELLKAAAIALGLL